MKVLRELLQSKKFVVSFLGVASAVAVKLGVPETKVTELAALVSPFLMYVGAQGLADLGKETMKVEAKRLNDNKEQS